MKSIYLVLAVACIALLGSACSSSSDNADGSASSSVQSRGEDDGPIIHEPGEKVDLDGVQFQLTGWRTYTHSNGITYTVLEASATNTGESLEQWDPMVTFIPSGGKSVDYTILDLREGLEGVFEAGTAEKLEWGFDMPPEALKKGTLKLFASDTWFGDFSSLPRQPETSIPLTDTPTVRPDETVVVETETPVPSVILGDYCTDHDATALTADGTTVYCARLQGTDAYLWHTAPGVVPNPALTLTPTATLPSDYGSEDHIQVCMGKTGQSREQCQAQIDASRPN